MGLKLLEFENYWPTVIKLLTKFRRKKITILAARTDDEKHSCLPPKSVNPGAVWIPEVPNAANLSDLGGLNPTIGVLIPKSYQPS